MKIEGFLVFITIKGNKIHFSFFAKNFFLTSSKKSYELENVIFINIEPQLAEKTSTLRLNLTCRNPKQKMILKKCSFLIFRNFFF